MRIGYALVVVVVAAACRSAPRAPDRSGPAEPPPGAPAAPAATPCGATTCAASEVCVPGGTTMNGVGDTVTLPPPHCEPLPAACGGVATCACVGTLCPIGHCSSVDSGKLVCLSG